MSMENPSFYEAFERMWQLFLTKLNNFVLNETFNGHIGDRGNPHAVTAQQVGLANVDNTSDMDKPISNLVQAALDGKADKSHTHSNYASSSHTHSNYASSSHTHSNYASSSHTHSTATTSKSGFMSASDKTKLDSMSESFNVLSAYPVGSIYMSTNSTSPASLFGGSWSRIKGRFLLGAGSNDSNTSTKYGSLSSGSINRSTIGELGGEVKHTLTISEIPCHSHTYDFCYPEGWYEVWEASSAAYTAYVCTDSEWGENSTYGTGGDDSHNNMPPYFVVYMWRRIEDDGTDPLYEEIVEEVLEEEVTP